MRSQSLFKYITSSFFSSVIVLVLDTSKRVPADLLHDQAYRQKQDSTACRSLRRDTLHNSVAAFVAALQAFLDTSSHSTFYRSIFQYIIIGVSFKEMKSTFRKKNPTKCLYSYKRRKKKYLQTLLQQVIFYIL